jgi:pimeloyl-ACP methyl ester carboxylesterase
MNPDDPPALDHRVHHRTVTVDGLDIFYREAGPKHGPRVLLLHGFPTSSHMFRDLIPLLAGRFHVVAPDYPGFGYSSTPDVTEFDYTFDRLADAIECFTEALGLASYALYVQDYGGPVGFRLATRHPERVTALIVQNANAYEEGVTELFQDVVLRLWTERTPETEAKVRALFELPITKKQYLDGAGDPTLVSPDAWTHAQWRALRRMARLLPGASAAGAGAVGQGRLRLCGSRRPRLQARPPGRRDPYPRRRSLCARDARARDCGGDERFPLTRGGPGEPDYNAEVTMRKLS